MIVRVFLVVMFSVAVSYGALRAGIGRQLLWGTIQACALDERMLHLAFPCIEIDARQSVDGGLAILRSPLDESHVVLAPTTRIIGIEAPRLRRADAHPFLDIAWSRRRFAYPTNLSAVPDADMGLAINSRRGRTQDQFHIHIDCLLDGVKARLDAIPLPPPGQWSLAQLDNEAPYSIRRLDGSLAGYNAIDLAARHLNLQQDTMPELTIAIVTRHTNRDGDPTFVLLAREDHGRQHAELLLDHDCRRYRRHFAEVIHR